MGTVLPGLTCGKHIAIRYIGVVVDTG